MATILAVDDTPHNLDILRHSLEMDGHRVLIAESGEKGLLMVDEQRPDLVLLDIFMPGMDGYQVLERLRSDSRCDDLPIIMLTANDLDASVVRCLEAGANDYVTKPFSLAVLSARINSALRTFGGQPVDDSSEHGGGELHGMDGVLARKVFVEECRRLIGECRDRERTLAMVSVGADNYPDVLETLGVATAEFVEQFGRILQDNLRDDDVLGYMGDERFAVCMPACRSFQALGVVERFRQSLQQFDWGRGGDDSRTTACIGLAMLTLQRDNWETLSEAADEALAEARSHGHDQIVMAAHN